MVNMRMCMQCVARAQCFMLSRAAVCLLFHASPMCPHVPHVFSPQPAKVKAISISTLRAQQQELVDNYRRICREMARLKPLMRLADYMVREGGRGEG